MEWMQSIKKIDKLLVKSFIPPFVLTFFISLFVLIMSFLWTYVDEIVGKGADIFMLSELIFYKSVSLFPMALPIAVIISSVMVMGNLSENYELTSIKSAGVPLLRTMGPLMIITFLISVFSYITTDSLIPVSNLQFQTRLLDIRKSKPTLNLEEGVFNDDFHGFIIHIGEKGEDERSIKDVLIYDHTQLGQGTANSIMAKNGEMFTSEDNSYFVMNLYDGITYQDVKEDRNSETKKYPYTRTEFKEWTKIFDLGEFEVGDSDERAYKKHYRMLNARQLAVAVDSIDVKLTNKISSNGNLAVKFLKKYKEPMRKNIIENTSLKNNLDKYDKKIQGKEKGNSQPTKNRKALNPEKETVINSIAAKNVESNKVDKPSEEKVNVKPNLEEEKRKKEEAKAKEAKRLKAKELREQKVKELDKKRANKKQSAAAKKRLNKGKEKAKKPQLTQLIDQPVEDYENFIATFLKKDRGGLLDKSKATARSLVSQLEANNRSIKRLKESRVRHLYEMHTKFTLSLACFVFLFIGAPMGAIIRKGGFGFPILVAIVFFVLFTVMNIFFKKMAEKLVMDPVLANWFPLIILAPIGMFLTVRAMQDKKIVDLDHYIQIIKSLFRRKEKVLEKANDPTL